MGAPADLVATIRAEVEQAADAILSATEQGLKLVTAARSGDADALDRLEAALVAIMEACAFQDITGQRLAILAAAIEHAPAAGAQADPLLNGPAAPGEGLDQSAADALLARSS